MRRTGDFTNNELRILWCIKRKGGKLRAEKVGNIYQFIADDTGVTLGSVRGNLRELEKASVVLRHFNRPAGTFASGPNKLLAVELVDPRMQLPPVEPIPLAVVIAHENDEMLERTAHEPETPQIMEALVVRLEELLAQIDKLQGVIEKLNEENEKLRKRGERKPPPEHLTSRIKDVLTAEQWEKMRHPES